MATYDITADDLPAPIPGSADTGPGFMFVVTGDAQEAAADLLAVLGGGAPVAGAMLRANNLSDVDDVGDSRDNLGLGTAAVEDATAFQAAGLALLIANNLSDVADVPTARGSLGLGDVAVLDLITEAFILLADNTTNNASTSNHGFLKKLSNVADEFMNGQGNWAAIGASTIVLVDDTTNDVGTSKHGFSPKAPGDIQKFLSGDGTWRYVNPAVNVLTGVTGNLSIDWAGHDEYRLTLSGNVDITAMTNMVAGKRYLLTIEQGSGGQTLTLSMSNKRFSADTPAGDFVLSTGAGLIDRIGLVYDGDDSKVDFVAINKGFA